MKIIVSILLSALNFCIFAQTPVLEEDFNTGFPSGWLLIDNDGVAPYNNPNVNFITDAFVITEDYDSTNIGDSILVATSWLDSNVSADDFLILPQVTLSSGGNYIYFDTKSVDQSYPDGLQLLYTFSDLSVDTIMSSGILFDTIASPPYWTNFMINLDTLDLQNKTVHFVFRHYGNDNFILALDNIKIETDNPLGIRNSKLTSLYVYPNPTTNIINIAGLTELEDYSIIDVSGKILKEGQTINTIQINLSSGIYFVKIMESVMKVIVK
jgi:hypothetical protein